MELTTLPFEEFVENRRAKAAKAKIPFSASIELTYGCNLNCLHCYNPTHRARDEVKTGEIFSILDQLAELGTYSISFTGGELLTRLDWLDILTHAREKGFSFFILTNATMITEEVACSLKALEPHQIDVSMYGASEETYEKVTRVKGSFKKFVRGVAWLKEKGIPFILKSIILTPNFHEAELMRRFSESMGVRFTYITEVNPRIGGSMEPLEYRISPRQDYELWRRYCVGPVLKEPAQKINSCHADQKAPFDCSCGKNSLSINPYGKMCLCLSMYYPQRDVKNGKVAQAWKYFVNYVESARPSPVYECHLCPVESECLRGPSDALLEMGDINACVPYHKEIATLKKEHYDRVVEAGENKKNNRATPA